MKRHGFFIKTFCMALVFLAAVGLFNKAFAEYKAGWRSADYVQARLISATTAVGDAKEIQGALEIRLSDGWHAYWRMPGAGGLPPRFDWDASDNLDAVQIKWPLPHRFKTLDLYSFGYENHVLLPFTAALTEAGQAASLKLNADIMVCSDICVPQNVMLALDVPAGAPQSSLDSARIERVIADLPYQENRPNLNIDNIVIGPKALVVMSFAQRGYDHADMYVESGDIYITAPPVIEQDADDPRKALIRIPAPDDIDNLFEAIGNRDVTLTFTDGVDTIERRFDFSEE